MNTVNQRQQKARDRKRASGLRKYELWLHPHEWQKLLPEIGKIVQKRMMGNT